MPEYYAADAESLGPSRTCIMGQPGVGKTGLAATWPDPYFIDLERGAGSTRAHRSMLSHGEDPYTLVLSEIAALQQARLDNGRLIVTKTVAGKPQTFPVATLVIDSLDVIQEAKKIEILGKRPKMQRDDWDTLFNQVYPVALAWNKLPIHVVVISHIRDLDGEEGKPGIRGFSVQGALRDKLPRWFDYILHIVSGDDGLRRVLSQPMINRGYQYVAKDRHGTFQGFEVKGVKGILPLALDKDGLPERVVAKTIVNRHQLVVPA